MIKKYRGETIRINVISAMKYEIENIIEEVTWNLTFAKRRTDKVFKNESVRSELFFCVDDKMTTHNLHCAESEQIHYFGKVPKWRKGIWAFG
jgi:restriction endonuclease